MQDPKPDLTSLVTIRDGIEEDNSFIFATWLKGLRHGNEYFRYMDGDSYFKAYHRVIEMILASPNVSVKVACLKEDQNVILAYAIYKKDRLDWVFCKKAWRGIGLCKSLVPSEIKTVSHLTKIGLSLIRKQPGIKFNPFSIP